MHALGALAIAFCLAHALDVPRSLLAAAGVLAVLVAPALRTASPLGSERPALRVASAVMVCTFWPLVLVLAFALSPLALYRVPSRSMEPTIEPGDLLIVDTWAYTRTLPERGDIVIFTAPGPGVREYVKRVVGLPEEPLRVVGHRVRVNGKALAEPYVRIDPVPPDLLELPDVGPLEVAPGHLYVLGDHRTHSVDSRNFGPVPFPLVRGRVLCVVWPLARLRILSAFRS